MLFSRKCTICVTHRSQPFKWVFWWFKFAWPLHEFFSFDLDLDAMTLVLKLDLDIAKMYLYTKNEVASFDGSKVIA